MTGVVYHWYITPVPFNLNRSPTPEKTMAVPTKPAPAKTQPPKPGANGKPAAAEKPKAKPAAFVKGEFAPATLPVNDLTFDPRLQHRSSLVNPEYVEEYAELLKENPAFQFRTRIRCVREVVKGADGKEVVTFWVFDGFQRGAGHKLAGRKSAEVEYINGTYEDAFLLSLSANSDHGKARTKDDKRRSVKALVENEDAMAAVKGKVKQFRGLSGAMAAAVGCSLGTVSNALTDLGLSIRGDKLVKSQKKDKPAAEPTPGGKAKADDAVSPAEPTTPEITEEDKKKANDDAYAALMAIATADRVNEARKLSKRLAAVVSSLIGDKQHGQEFRRLMEAAGMGVNREYDVKATGGGSGFQPYFEILEHWPVAANLGTLFASFKKVLDDQKATGKEAGQK